MEKQRQEALEAEKQAERSKQLEAQREQRRNQTVELRLKAAREAERQQHMETERLRTIALTKEKAYIQAALEQVIISNYFSIFTTLVWSMKMINLV